MILKTAVGSAATRTLLELLRVQQTHSLLPVSLLFMNEIFPAQLQKPSIRSSCVLAIQRRWSRSFWLPEGSAPLLWVQKLSSERWSGKQRIDLTQRGKTQRKTLGKTGAVTHSSLRRVSTMDSFRRGGLEGGTGDGLQGNPSCGHRMLMAFLWGRQKNL